MADCTSKNIRKNTVSGRSKNVSSWSDVAGNAELSLNDKVEAINILKEKTTSGKVGAFGELLLSSNAKKYCKTIQWTAVL